MMAVFMVNICKFDGCGIIFQGLGDLIQHIEESHIDDDPVVIEKQEEQHPVSLPLSYVLRFFTDAARKEFPDVKPKIKSIAQNNSSQNQGPKTSHSPTNKTLSTTLVQRNFSPAGSDIEEDEAMTDSDSNDSWTTSEEFSSEYILRYGSRCITSSPTNPNQMPEKPFACPVPGCKKRYKNVNGIKYHSKNGHKNDGKIRKAFKCHCGKSYKTTQGLKMHTTTHHSGANLTTITTQMGEILQIPSREVAAALSPLRTVTLKPLVTTSGLNVSALSGALGLPVKALQGVVLSAKAAQHATQLKGTVIDANSFNLAAALAAKKVSATSVSHTISRSQPASSTKSSGLFINTINITQPFTKVTAVSESTTSGILTPATSPQTPPLTPDSQTTAKLIMSLPSQHMVTLPLTPVSPATTPPLGLETMDALESVEGIE
ncbi:zinc finger X-linked protein ZXDA [Frankliniella occidentalis]|uniref:Zinc finger X-linked protein ZXDA n=1 Tax=Frankliniella occidentalis TaxID=133901 RepID=A0A6J1T141_FRAOC|nr:zinc finger X-linked protein ZXDA [Frankliniella occidentalis]